MADVLHPPIKGRFAWHPALTRVLRRVLALAVSYEVAAYSLATVQAIGLTLPSMVNGGPAVHRTACRQHMLSLLNAGERWKARHPGFHLHRPQMGELAQYFSKGLPECPSGGDYHLVYPGQTVRVEGSGVAVVPQDRLGVRCAMPDGSAPHGEMLSR